MDVLTDMLQTVRLCSHLYGRMELTAPGAKSEEGADRPGSAMSR